MYQKIKICTLAAGAMVVGILTTSGPAFSEESSVPVIIEVPIVPVINPEDACEMEGGHSPVVKLKWDDFRQSFNSIGIDPVVFTGVADQLLKINLDSPLVLSNDEDDTTYNVESLTLTKETRGAVRGYNIITQEYTHSNAHMVLGKGGQSIFTLVVEKVSSPYTGNLTLKFIPHIRLAAADLEGFDFKKTWSMTLRIRCYNT